MESNPKIDRLNNIEQLYIAMVISSKIKKRSTGHFFSFDKYWTQCRSTGHNEFITLMHPIVPDQRAVCSSGELHYSTIIIAQVVDVLILAIERVWKLGREDTALQYYSLQAKIQKMLIST